MLFCLLLSEPITLLLWRKDLSEYISSHETTEISSRFESIFRVVRAESVLASFEKFSDKLSPQSLQDERTNTHYNTTDKEHNMPGARSAIAMGGADVMTFVRSLRPGFPKGLKVRFFFSPLHHRLIAREGTAPPAF